MAVIVLYGVFVTFAGLDCIEARFSYRRP